MLLDVNQAILRCSRQRQLVVSLIGRAEELIDEMHGMALLKAGDETRDEFLIIRWRESWRPKVDKAALDWSGGGIRWDSCGRGRERRLQSACSGGALKSRRSAANQGQAKDDVKRNGGEARFLAHHVFPPGQR